MRKYIELDEEKLNKYSNITFENNSLLVEGIDIHSEYLSTAEECIDDCFEDGKFKYLKFDGSPMEIEVPLEIYEEAVIAMEQKIINNEVPGIKDVSYARNIIKQGKYSYKQVKNIARAGNIDSIKYDARNGSIVASRILGITATIAFAISIWEGDRLDKAVRNSFTAGFKVSGLSFISSILSNQFFKTSLSSFLISISEFISRTLGPIGSANLVNALGDGSKTYGHLAMKSAKNMIKFNLVASIVSFILISIIDLIDKVKGRISTRQFIKNIILVFNTSVMGTIGWVFGASIGGGIGNYIDFIKVDKISLLFGFIGSLLLGSMWSRLIDGLLSKFIRDDSDEVFYIIEDELNKLLEEYILTNIEIEQLIKNLKSVLNMDVLKDIFQSENRVKSARLFITLEIEEIIALRKNIKSKELEKEAFNIFTTNLL